MRTDLGQGMRRVYLISTAFQGEYEVGFANGLVRNGVPVTVIGSDRTLAGRLDAGVEFLNLRGDQNPGRTRREKVRGILRYFLALRRTARQDPAAIFHTNGLFALRSGFGVLLEALWCGWHFREWWLTVHNLLPHDNETAVNRLVFGVTYRIPRRLFAHTRATARELVGKFGVDPARVHVVEHGIDRFVPPDPASKERIRQRFSLPSFRILVVLFGNISRYKGVDLLLEAIDRSELPDGTAVLIAGRSSSTEYSTQLRMRLAHMRDGSRTFWADEYLADADIPDLLAAADCMVLPYRKIDQSGVIFAAKSAGVPIVAFDVGSFKAYADAGRDVIVPAGDVGALAAGLAHVAARGPLSDRNEFVELARRRFAWQVTLQAYAGLVKAGHAGVMDAATSGRMEGRV